MKKGVCEVDRKKEIEEQVISTYKQDERMMILVFAQWCINHDLNPEDIYLKAYPTQKENKELKEAISLTVSKEEAGEINNETVLGVLSLFGNDDLAFIVSEEMEKLKK
ncbi:hypothetical protein HXA34_13355 [Salipaludibacillus agaradhaerens]|uniref:hypothetical protein n=1 Tax=Salipaludibacillus agaradhaerens TaxID=76935 RepID=UPI00215104C6|nr:hypothetical protein [Salipaludibacillus agaradhaerens]MCR6107286.1 hypothetical protein [Salipaludibacillus agaradhaerens]MCR6119315.1 hypothetical protein [Salipaludibacillus agaradhaerens]